MFKIKIQIHSDHILVNRPCFRGSSDREEKRYDPPTSKYPDCSDTWLRLCCSSLGVAFPEGASYYERALRAMAEVCARHEGYLPQRVDQLETYGTTHPHLAADSLRRSSIS